MRVRLALEELVKVRIVWMVELAERLLGSRRRSPHHLDDLCIGGRADLTGRAE